MSPADSAEHRGPLRTTYGAELEQLRLQIEVMGVMVDQNLERMRQVLETGDPGMAEHALAVMAVDATDLFRSALQASRSIDLAYAQLIETPVALREPDAAAIAMRSLVAGQALERIADPSAILGSRLRYLITGDPGHLAAEIRR
jgi:hypothetical protein